MTTKDIVVVPGPNMLYNLQNVDVYNKIVYFYYNYPPVNF